MPEGWPNAGAGAADPTPPKLLGWPKLPNMPDAAAGELCAPKTEPPKAEVPEPKGLTAGLAAGALAAGAPKGLAGGVLGWEGGLKGLAAGLEGGAEEKEPRNGLAADCAGGEPKGPVAGVLALPKGLGADAAAVVATPKPNADVLVA